MLLTPETTGITVTSIASAVIDPNTGDTQEYRQLIANPATHNVWLHTAANEFG
jgi:hypothetical protein